MWRRFMVRSVDRARNLASTGQTQPSNSRRISTDMNNSSHGGRKVTHVTPPQEVKGHRGHHLFVRLRSLAASSGSGIGKNFFFHSGPGNDDYAAMDAQRSAAGDGTGIEAGKRAAAWAAVDGLVEASDVFRLCCCAFYFLSDQLLKHHSAMYAS